jgi:hypothetical protein
MDIRRKFLWLILLTQLLALVVYLFVLNGHGNNIDTTVGFLTRGVLNLLPSSAASSVLSTSDYVLAYWFFVLGVAFISSILLASVLAITDGKTSYLSRVFWLLAFTFLGFIAVPTYCILKLRAKSVASAT